MFFLKYDIMYYGDSMKKENLKQSIIGLCIVISYFIYSYFQTVPLNLIGINYYDLSLFDKIVYLMVTELIYLLILFFIYRKEYIKDFKDYIKNFKNYMPKYMEYWALAFSLMLISNFIIITLFPNSVATNQEAINDILVEAPFYMITSAVLFAPFLEETIFRFSFRKIFKNDLFFIIISGLVFGSLHVVGSFSSFVDLIYIIPYSIPGCVFAYTLVKSKNIFVPMSLHFFHNGIMMFIETVLLFFL